MCDEACVQDINLDPATREEAKSTIAVLVNRLLFLEKKNQELEKRIQELEARLAQNSQNSSRPPSSDGPHVKRKPPKESSGKKPGGQPGHKGVSRDLVPPEKVGKVVDVLPEKCAICGGVLDDSAVREDHSRIQVAELPDLFALVTEYRMWRCKCPKCGGKTRAQRPENLSDVPFGTKLQAFVAMLCSSYRMSRRNATKFMEDLFGIKMSAATVQGICERASDAVAPAVEKVTSEVAASPVVNVDETGWKEKGKTAWVWNVTTPDAELFNISPSRGAAGLAGVLPENYDGTVCTDRWGVYMRFPDENRGICHAHLRRDDQALIDRGGEAKVIGEKFLKLSDDLFKVWHAFKRGEFGRDELVLRTHGIRVHWGRIVSAALECPDKKARALGKYMDKHWWSLWTFLYREGVEPTNNEAERALRKVVIWRKNCFGTQSAAGSKFVGNMMTVAGTAKRRNINLFDFLTKACEAAALGQPAPFLNTC